MRRLLAFAALGLFSYAVFLGALLPASFIASRIAADSGGAIAFGAVHGTPREGDATVTVRTPGAAPYTLERVTWQWRATRLALGEVAFDVTVASPGLTFRGQAARGFGGWRARDVEGTAQATALTALAAPLAYAAPGGTVTLAAPALDWDGASLRGDLKAEWRDASVRLSEVRPLGAYRLELHGEGGPAAFTVATAEGSLRLAGRGTFEGPAKLAFSGEARGEGAQAAALAPLLGLFGPRRPDGSHALEWRAR